jgi:outer membrane protein OmpA-like peptidoglycan-associated protein
MILIKMRVTNNFQLRQFYISILFILLCFGLTAQNLVPNGSFEDFTVCPEDFSSQQYTPYVSKWDSPNRGTPDYFNACSYKCGVPTNWVGNADAFHGNAYMGIIGCMQQLDRNQIAYREYLRVELIDTLRKGTLYLASMQLRLGESSSVSCNGMAMHFTSNPMNSVQTYNYPVTPNVLFQANKIIDNKATWTQVCGTFEAHGGERFLIIGNFLSDQQLKYKEWDENLIRSQTILPSAYYYVDDVKVLEYTDTLDYVCEGLDVQIPEPFMGTLEPDSKMILKNLYFEVDKAVILKDSYHELDQLAFELKRKSHLKIAIYGHTDNTGNPEYNHKLSEERALAVRNYLLEKGVSTFRMTTQGFGATQPIADNDTEESKQLNRRVEIEVN